MEKIIEVVKKVYPGGTPFVIENWNEYVKNPSSFAPIKEYMIPEPLKFKDRCAIYSLETNRAQENYQFVFISVLEDCTVLVVGKTSFWSNVLVNGERDSSEDSTFGDLIKPYNKYRNTRSAKEVIKHYNDNSIDIDSKITKVIIVPIDVSDFSTKEAKKKNTDADRYAENIETLIGDAILNNGIRILNEFSHRH